MMMKTIDIERERSGKHIEGVIVKDPAIPCIKVSGGQSCKLAGRVGATSASYYDRVSRLGGRNVAAIRVFTSLVLLAAAVPFLALGQSSEINLSSSGMTPELLEARITLVKGDPSLGDDAKSVLLGFYQEASEDLAQASAYVNRASQFNIKAQNAPQQLKELREQVEKGLHVSLPAPLGVTEETPLDQLQEYLDQETAKLATADVRISELETRLSDAQDRPSIIRARMSVAKQEQEELLAEMGEGMSPVENPDVHQAQEWAQAARSEALAAELQLLNQELLTQPLLEDLLRSQLTKENQSIEVVQNRVAALRDRVHAKRSTEAEAAKHATEQALRETVGLDPVLEELAAQNVELTETLKEQVTELQQMSQQLKQVEQHRKRIELNLKDLQIALQTYGRTEGFGRLLLRQYESLPDIRFYVRRARIREQQFAKLGVGRLDHRGEARRMADLNQAIAEFEAQMPADRVQELHEPLVELLQARLALLGKVMDADEFYLEALNTLNIAEKELLTVAESCEEFLVENLLWLRSAEPTRWRDLRDLPQEIRGILDPMVWAEMGRILRREALPSPLFWLTLGLVGASVVKRRAVTEHIQAYAELTAKPLKDGFVYTLRALAETLVLAAPWPLLMAVVGLTFRSATPTSTLSYDTGHILLIVSLHFYMLRALSLLCIPHGVAAAHFRWSECDVSLLRRSLIRLMLVFIPSVLVLRFAIQQAPGETGGTLARLSLVLCSGALTVFFYYLFISRREWLAKRRLDPEGGFLMNAYPVWCTLLIVFPVGLSVLALSGYIYSAAELSSLCLQTMGLISALVILHQLIMRSLRIMHRRLAYAAAVKRRQAAFEARKQEVDVDTETLDSLLIEEPEIDLDALSGDTRELVRIGTMTAGLVGVYVIWLELLPALRILDEVTLLNISLGSTALALFSVVVTTVLAKRLPAVLEISLLRFADLTAGSRHATTTLCTYAIVTVGTLFAMNALGLRWAQFQWLIAALGVGIGFGLQEVVANFICGLIILFERPIRVGDVVTIGDTDGVVTRIRIRATTIRNWDRKELLVPNKEFITGRLLNWTLSDQVTRVVVPVGVAYGSDTDQALALMKEAATENENVLLDPAPMVTFEGFGDNSLSLLLRAYLGSIEKRLPTTTDLHKAIDRKFRDAGIVIAFPQSDVHLDISEPLRFSAGPQNDSDGAFRDDAQNSPKESP